MGRKPRYQIGAQLSYEKHSELIDRLDKEAPGAVQRIIIKGLELYYSLPPSERRDPVKQLAVDMHAVRRAVEGLPAQLEQMLANIAIIEESPAMPPVQAVPMASEEDLARRRANRMKTRY